MNIEFAQKLNQFGCTKTPFFFAIDYAAKHFYVSELDALDDDIFFSFERDSNVQDSFTCKNFSWHKTYPDYALYRQKINAIQREIEAGNTYVLNLTAQTHVVSNETMLTLFHAAKAPFKLYFKDQFVCFSPERFVKIEQDTISTFPMKGTIDANLPHATKCILEDEKEKAEHVMVVDLLRNDLSMVAKNVCVEQFRYIDKIQAGEKELLQVSSKITGKLDSNWHEKVGDILATLLPAGSISGTPKKSSVAIIEKIEGYERGFFTGVFGVYDGVCLDSAVMIRFLEKTDEGFVFKSGGGITALSDAQKEYEELCNKVYIPLL